MADSSLDNDSKFEIAKERKNSTVLHRYKISNPELISRVVDILYDELVEYYELNGQRKSTVDKLMHHLDFFVTNLYAVSLSDPTKFIAFSKNDNVYSDPKSKYKKSYKLRVTVRNNSTRLRRIWVRLQGTSSDAYQDTCRWM
jgi:hypothetical protein